MWGEQVCEDRGLCREEGSWPWRLLRAMRCGLRGRGMRLTRLCAQNRPRPDKLQGWRLEQRMVYGGMPSKENGQPLLRRPKLPGGFQGRVLKATFGVRAAEGMTFLLTGGW